MSDEEFIEWYCQTIAEIVAQEQAEEQEQVEGKIVVK